MRTTLLLCAALTVVTAANAATFTVSNVNDSGPGSLRQAILDTNASSDPSNTIAFSIGSGTATITPASELPAITKPVTIDGTTQPGFAGPVITLDGSGFTGARTGLRLAGGSSTVKGLTVVNWSDGSFSSVAISVTSTGNSITGNHVGVHTPSYKPRTNDTGLRIAAGAHGTQVMDNLLLGNRLALELTGGAPTTGLGIRGNQFGTHYCCWSPLDDDNDADIILNDASGAVIGAGGSGNLIGKGITLDRCTGTVVQANEFNNTYAYVATGVMITGGGGNRVGGTTSDVANSFLYFKQAIAVADSGNNTIEGNYTEANASVIRISASAANPNSADNNVIGGTTAGAGNRLYSISPGWSAGIVIVNAKGCSILGNTLRSSRIDLGGDGATPNDLGDGDSGANNLQNAPVLARVIPSAGNLNITGTLNSTAYTTFRVELFNDGTYFGFTNVASDASGNAPFAVALPGSGYGTITATATDPDGNTSELSAGVPIDRPGDLSFTSYVADVAENASSFDVTVVRSGGALGTVSVDYVFKDGTAKAGVDYTGGYGTLTFADLETTKTFPIHIIDNHLYDGARNFTVSLASATGGGYIHDPSTMRITIADDDAPPVLSITDLHAVEGDSGTREVAMPVTLSEPGGVPVTVHWFTSQGTALPGQDYVQDYGTLTFNPGETQKSILVHIIGNTLPESTKMFYVYLPLVQGATLPAPNYRFCYIENDDEVQLVTADDLRVPEGNAGTTTAVVTLRANRPVTGTISYETIAGTAIADADFTPVSGTVDLSNETEKQIAIPIIGNTAVGPDRQFTVHLVPDATLVLTRFDITVTIANDDVGIGPRSQTIAEGSSGVIFIDVGNPVSAPQTLALSSRDHCVNVPETVKLATGAHTASVAVEAVSAPCSTRVDVTFPAALGGSTMSAGIGTYRRLAIAFDPRELRLIVGQTAHVRMTAAGFDGAAVIPLAALGETAEVPPSVVLTAAGASFPVKGLKAGALTIRATSPPENGSAAYDLYGEVVDAPPTPTILQVAPGSGPTTGGTPVIITGLNFRGDCTFAFGGIPAAAVSFASATMMSAMTPPHVAGVVGVAVTCGADSYTFDDAFTYLSAAPVVTSVVPSFGSVAGGTRVRITGRDLRPDCWPFFDASAGRQVSVPSTTEMIATTPAHAAGGVTVSILCGNAEARLGNAFSYSTAEEPAPVIASVDPGAAAPGETVRIGGLRFRTTDTVTFDTAATPLLATSCDAQLVAVPSMPPGSVSVNVRDTAGRLSTTGPIFLVLEPMPPRVTRLSPASAPAGAEVAFDGSGFRAPYAFRIGGADASIVSMTFTRVVLRVPALAPGSYDVRILNSSGQVAGIGGSFTVTATGVMIDGVAPSCAVSTGGTTVTISGSGLAAGAKVTVGDTVIGGVTVIDDRHIEATLPPLPPGFPTIVVTNPDGKSGTATNALRIDSPFDPDGCGVPQRQRPARTH